MLDTAHAWTPDAEVLFIADPDDLPELAELESQGANYITVDGNYAMKINEGIRRTESPFIFTGADDLLFHPGWFDTAKARLGDGIEVVGVNDLCSRRVMAGEHATHFLMTREYAETPCLDSEPGPFSQAYHHWFCDDELVATARRRNAIVFETDSIVEHLHPQVRKAPDDQTYRRGRENRWEDERTFKRRAHLWM